MGQTTQPVKPPIRLPRATHYQPRGSRTTEQINARRNPLVSTLDEPYVQQSGFRVKPLVNIIVTLIRSTTVGRFWVFVAVAFFVYYQTTGFWVTPASEPSVLDKAFVGPLLEVEATVNTALHLVSDCPRWQAQVDTVAPEMVSALHVGVKMAGNLDVGLDEITLSGLHRALYKGNKIKFGNQLQKMSSAAEQLRHTVIGLRRALNESLTAVRSTRRTHEDEHEIALSSMSKYLMKALDDPVAIKREQAKEEEWASCRPVYEQIEGHLQRGMAQFAQMIQAITRYHDGISHWTVAVKTGVFRGWETDPEVFDRQLYTHISRYIDWNASSRSDVESFWLQLERE